MHDTHDIRKSKELHDKEMNLDQREPNPSDLTDHRSRSEPELIEFRADLIQLLKRIAKALEQPIQVRKEF